MVLLSSLTGRRRGVERGSIAQVRLENKMKVPRRELQCPNGKLWVANKVVTKAGK